MPLSHKANIQKKNVCLTFAAGKKKTIQGHPAQVLYDITRRKGSMIYLDVASHGTVSMIIHCITLPTQFKREAKRHLHQELYHFSCQPDLLKPYGFI